MNALFLALAHLRHHPWRSGIMVLLLALILAVPACLNLLLAQSERGLTQRAEATPLIIGRTGSQIDLAMKSLYFSDDTPALVSVKTENAVWDSGFADAIPLYARFEASQAPIVGTSLDYFDFRELTLADGRLFAQLGEAVLGHSVAERLGLGPGSVLVSTPENLFDLAGAYPLEMQIVGVLSQANSPDDEAVFVDVKTAWVIEGLGHGHQDVIASDATGDDVRAAAGLIQYNRITDENRESFHFHGSPSDFPLSSVIALPYDKRAETILRGRYLSDEATEQAIIPQRVVSRLLDRIFQIKKLFDLVMVVVLAATALAVGLVLFLSVELRRGEGRTAYLLGARRGLIWRLVLTEMGLLLVVAALLATSLTWLLATWLAPVVVGLI